MTTFPVPLMAIISVPRGWRLGLPFIGAIAAAWITESMPLIGTAAFAVAVLFAWVQLPVISKAQARLVGLGTILAILMFIGAASQAWNPIDNSDHLTLSFGFAALFMLSVLAAGMPRAVLLSGFRMTRYIGIAYAVYAWVLSGSGGRLFGPAHMNPNAFSGFLAFTALQWLLLQDKITTRQSFIAGFIFSSVIFTGSRWILIVFAVVLLALFLQRRLSFNGALIIGMWILTAAWIAVAPTVTVLRHSNIHEPEIGVVATTASTLERTVVKGSVDVQARLEQSASPGFMPKGWLGGPIHGNAMHSIYQRAAVETGWIGLAILLIAFGYSLKQGNGTRRFLILFLMALGIMDLYTWWGVQLVPIQWAVMALAVTDRQNLSVEEPV